MKNIEKAKRVKKPKRVKVRKSAGYMADDFRSGVDLSLFSRLKAAQGRLGSELTGAQKQYVEEGIEALGSGKWLSARVVNLLEHIIGGW